MDDIRIFIITHKDFKSVTNEEVYEPLVVGAEKNKVNYCNNDNTGKNISEKNPYYCELTGQYWIWKNINCNISGLVHYRRYFEENGKILGKEEIEKYLQKNDFIIAKKHYLTKSIYDVYKQSQLMKYLEQMMEVLKEEYPDYWETFDRVMKKKYTYPCNMLICNKDNFDKYSEWLFDVLFRTEKKVKELRIETEPRAYGFLSENLLITYILTNNKSFATFPVYNVEISRIEQKWTNVKNFLIGSIRTVIERRKNA